MTINDRICVWVDDAHDLQSQIESNSDYRFVAAIPWGDRLMLAFESVEEL